MQKSVKRRNNPLSREQIIDATIEILDRHGEEQFTFRGLAQFLATGAGALYHYVANKEDILSLATDKIIEQYLSAIPDSNDPSQSLKNVSIALWDAVDDHPWVGLRLIADPNRPTIARVYEAIGRQLQALGVPEAAQFDVGSSLGSYICGNLAQKAGNAMQARRLAHSGYNRETYLAEFTKSWRELDESEFPFMHKIIDKFPTHDDRAQYLAGIDLLLAGIAQQYQAD